MDCCVVFPTPEVAMCTCADMYSVLYQHSWLMNTQVDTTDTTLIYMNKIDLYIIMSVSWSSLIDSSEPRKGLLI